MLVPILIEGIDSNLDAQDALNYVKQILNQMSILASVGAFNEDTNVIVCELTNLCSMAAEAVVGFLESEQKSAD